jgi:hypothetical protein
MWERRGVQRCIEIKRICRKLYKTFQARFRFVWYVVRNSSSIIVARLCGIASNRGFLGLRNYRITRR